MKKLLLSFTLLSIILPSLAQASFLGFLTTGDLKIIQTQLDAIQKQLDSILKQSQPLLGAAVVQAQKFKLSGSGISSSATSMTLQTFKLPDASTTIAITDFSGNVGYGTIEPGTSKEEQISFTGVTQNGDGTATLTGLSRGLDFRGSNCAATSANQKSHAGASIFVLSNTACFYGGFTTKSGNEYITGIWTFASSSLPRASSTPIYGSGDELKFVTYGQLASTTLAGAVDGTETAKGIYQTASTTYIGVGTALGSTGATLLVPNSRFNATSTATTTVPVTRGYDGKISPTFIATSSADNYQWNGISTFIGSTTLSGINTLSGTTTLATTTIHGKDVESNLGKFGGTGADGALSITNGTTTVSLGNAPVVVKNYTSISITGGGLGFSATSTGGSIVILKSQGNCTITSASTTAISLEGVGGAGGIGGTNAITATPGTGFGYWINGIAQTGGPTGGFGQAGAGGASANTAGTAISTSTASVSPNFSASSTAYIKTYAVPGSGGGGGPYGGANQGGNGGTGGGALYMECAGALNITGKISAIGAPGNPITSAGGAGGGGGGGSIVILYNSLTTDSGTYTVSGGAGGTGSGGGVSGGAGGAGYARRNQNTEF